MRKTLRICTFLVALALLTVSCSRKGVHMSKHRKSRKCNCPTFSETLVEPSLTDTIHYCPLS